MKKKKDFKCCENCIFYKQYYTLHNLCLVAEDNGFCCRTGELNFVEDICKHYEPIEYANYKSSITKKVREIILADNDE